MSTIDWQFVLADQYGVPYGVLDDYDTVGLGLVVNGVSSWSISVPLERIDLSWLRPDTRLLCYHRQQLLLVGLLRRWSARRSGGLGQVHLVGVDQNGLLERRIIAYYANSTASSKAGPADDVVKAIVRENMGALATDSARDLTAEGLSVQGDLSRGPNIDKAFSWRQQATIIREIAEVAASLAQPLYYAIVPLGPASFEFRTWIDQPGLDRSQSGPDPLLLGEAMDNMDNLELAADYTRMANVVYAAGQGEAADRDVVEVYDPNALASSPLARIELFADARQATSLSQIEDVGRAALLAAGERRTFGGTLLSGPGCAFGSDWHLGDRVTASFLGLEFDCLIGAVAVAIDSSGERITAQLEQEILRPRAIAVNIWAGGS